MIFFYCERILIFIYRLEYLIIKVNYCIIIKSIFRGVIIMDNLTRLEKEYIKSNFQTKSKEDLALKLKKDAALINEYIETLEATRKNKEVKKSKKDGAEKIKREPIFNIVQVVPYNVSKIDFIFGAVAFFLTLVLYTLTLTPSLSAGDNGELTTAAYFLGVGHAPGYPFYTLMSKIFTYLPINNIAWRTNFFSAFCAALSIFAFYLILVKVLGQNRITKGFSPLVQIPAFLSSLMFTISDNMWAQATMAEVYSLNILQIATMILLLIYWFESVWNHANDEAPYYGTRYLMVFGFLYGVALANHHITLPFAFAPLLAIFLVLVVVHKHRYINHIETSFISIFIFLFLLIVGGFGYYRFIMSYEAYLYFPPGVLSNDSFLSIIFKPLLDVQILSDIILGLSSGEYLRPDKFAELNNPSYPTLYKGIFLVFWPIFFVVTWFLVYKYMVQKNEKFYNDNDYITGIGMAFYQMFFMLLLGILIYAYMPIRARALPPLNWGQLNEPTGWENLSYFFSMLHRKQYGASGNDVKALFILHPEQVRALITIFKEQLTNWGLFFIIPGLFQIFKKNKFMGGFALFGLLTFSVSLMVYTNPPPSERTLFFVEIFFLPATLYLMMIVGFGAQWYMEYFNKNIVTMFKKNNNELADVALDKFQAKHIVSTLVIIAIITPIFMLNLKRNNNYNDYSNHDYSYNLMNSIPPNAIFATEGGDNQVFGLVYYTMVERRRPDLKVYDQKGNVFERVYGNLMKTDGRWIGEISENVDADFIESGRPYYMAWKRNGIEKLGDYYFKPYGLVFRVLPIRYAFLDELEFFKSLTVNEYKALASSNLKRDYTDDLVATDINTLLDEGLINTSRKNIYNGNEVVTFVKMKEDLIFGGLETEEDYWDSYTMHGTPEEQTEWDFLTREIFISSYGLAKIDLYNRRINMYSRLMNKMGNNEVASNGLTADEIVIKIDEYKNLKMKEEENILAVGFDMSNVFFILGGQAIMNKEYEKSAEMFKRVLDLEKLVYPAYFNLVASYEFLARSEDTPYEEEAKYLDMALEVLSQAESTFYRGVDMGQTLREANPNYNQVMQYKRRIELQKTNTRLQAASIKEQAVNENTFQSYSSYANYVYQSRQDIEEALWAKEEAFKRAVKKEDKLATSKEISILHVNTGNTQKSVDTIQNAKKNIKGLTKTEIEGLDFDIANIYLNLKIYEQAANIYKKYTNNISQNGAFSLYALGHIATQEGDLEEALSLYNQFDKMLPVALTNENVAGLKAEIDNIKVQIINYINQSDLE